MSTTNVGSRSVLAIVLNWNGIADTLGCLTHLAAQDYADLDILVVDNGSSDDSLDQLRPLAADRQIQLLENGANFGFAGGVNRGVQYAMAQNYAAIALVNNDALVAPDWVSKLSRELFATNAAIVTGLLLDGDGRLIDSSGDFYSQWGMPSPRGRNMPAEQAPPSGPVFSASGGGSIYRTTLFHDIGLFDDQFFAYFEDVDLGFRAQLRGHEVHYVHDALARHQRGASSGRVPGFTTYQSLKNLPLLFWRNLPASVVARVGPRFALLYAAILFNAIRTGRGSAAIRGAARGLSLTLTHALPTRREIQRSRTVSSKQIADLLTTSNPFRPPRDS